MTREPTSHERMTGQPWNASYQDEPAPWDVGGPQRAVVRRTAPHQPERPASGVRQPSRVNRRRHRTRPGPDEVPRRQRRTGLAGDHHPLLVL
ncbi:hypothetical protein ALI144C_20070 [Actinosynnema sp. ALI-1.44]|nr:hypothetical protein ALI144C_20070 [Actinosynnema sp. ALI-1.44]